MYKWFHTVIGTEEARASDPPELRDSELQKILVDSEQENQEYEKREGENEEERSELNDEDLAWIGSAVLLKIIELEKEMDLMRETLSILRDFSVEHLYLLLSEGDEIEQWK